MRSQLVRGLLGAVLVTSLAIGLVGVLNLPAVVREGTRAAPPVVVPPVSGAEVTVQSQERSVRDVTPQGIARVFGAPETKIQRTTRAARSIQIKHAGVVPDGSIVGNNQAVRLYGVDFPDVKKVCATASGERWPCGRRAYIALHNKVATQAVSCEPRGTPEAMVADCFLGEVNLAVWLLSQGLVRLHSDVSDRELVAAESVAKHARLGLWSGRGD